MGFRQWTPDPSDWGHDVVTGWETGLPPIFARIFRNKMTHWRGIKDHESATLAKIGQLKIQGLRPGIQIPPSLFGINLLISAKMETSRHHF